MLLTLFCENLLNGKGQQAKNIGALASSTENMNRHSVRYETDKIEQQEIYFLILHRIFNGVSFSSNERKAELTHAV
jgi:hypothetical protein